MSNTKGFQETIFHLLVYRFDGLGLIAIENKAVAFEQLTVGSKKEPQQLKMYSCLIDTFYNHFVLAIT